MEKTELLALMLFSAAGVMIRYRTFAEIVPGIIFACMLMVCACTDLTRRVIPDRLLAAGACIKFLTLPIQSDMENAFAEAAVGALALSLILLPVSLVYEMIRKRSSIGGGDIKLLVLAGAWLGPWDGLTALLISCLLSLVQKVWNKNERHFPWGPAIAIGAYAVMVLG